MKYRFHLKPFRFSILAPFCAVLAAASLTSCSAVDELSSMVEGRQPPPCPQIKLLKDADIVTVYRPGPGRDITDIRYEAELKGFSGECDYVGDDGVYSSVNLSIRVSYDISRGPAEKGNVIKVPYFVAIPHFYPRPEGRSDFVSTAKFIENRDNMVVVDDPIHISLPLTKERSGPDTEVYIGFVLTKNQLEFNREKRRATGLSNP